MNPLIELIEKNNAVLDELLQLDQMHGERPTPRDIAMTATNYFRTIRAGWPTQVSDMFPFVNNDTESTQAAWDAALAHISGEAVRIVAWRKPMQHGPWAEVKLVGISPPDVKAIGRPWIARAPGETVN